MVIKDSPVKEEEAQDVVLNREAKESLGRVARKYVAGFKEKGSTFFAAAATTGVTAMTTTNAASGMNGIPPDWM